LQIDHFVDASVYRQVKRDDHNQKSARGRNVYPDALVGLVASV
jgi:hypothetical protein